MTDTTATTGRQPVAFAVVRGSTYKRVAMGSPHPDSWSVKPVNKRTAQSVMVPHWRKGERDERVDLARVVGQFATQADAEAAVRLAREAWTANCPAVTAAEAAMKEQERLNALALKPLKDQLDADARTRRVAALAAATPTALKDV